MAAGASVGIRDTNLLAKEELGGSGVGAKQPLADKQ